MSINLLFAGLTRLILLLCLVHFSESGPSGTFELSFDGALSKFIDPEDVAFGRKKEYGPI